MTREMWSAVLAIATVLAVIAFLPPKPMQLGGISITNPPTSVIDAVRAEYNGKYKFHPKGELRDDIYVHEYATADGQSGYQIFQEEMRADGKYLRSFGEGVEATQRSFDWKLIEPLATST